MPSFFELSRSADRLIESGDARDWQDAINGAYMLSAASDAGGQWVTIDGAHVLIKNGVVAKGPKHLVGKQAGKRTKAPAPAPHKKDAEKSARAKSVHKASTKEKQDWAEKNEHEAADKLNAQKSDDNRPADLTMKHKGQLHGVEIKTMLDNGNDKITVHPESQARKLAWAKSNGAKFHTLVIDDRNDFGGGRNADQYSGHRLYYKEGTGAFRLNGMTPVRDYSHLKSLITGAGP